MRVVGHRREPPISFSASAENLARGARFNEDLQRLPGGGRTLVRKGVYRFVTHEEANRHDAERIVAEVTRAVLDRR